MGRDPLKYLISRSGVYIAAKYFTRLDAYKGVSLPIPNVNMGRQMIVVEHADFGPADSHKDGHRSTSQDCLVRRSRRERAERPAGHHGQSPTPKTQLDWSTPWGIETRVTKMHVNRARPIILRLAHLLVIVAN